MGVHAEKEWSSRSSANQERHLFVLWHKGQYRKRDRFRHVVCVKRNEGVQSDKHFGKVERARQCRIEDVPAAVQLQSMQLLRLQALKRRAAFGEIT